MALTLEDKSNIVFALCHNIKILDVNSTHYDSIFNSRLEGLSTFAEDRIALLLTQIEAAKDKLLSSPVKSNVKRIGDIELDTSMSLKLIQKEVNRLRNELASLLDIPNNCRGGGCMVNVCQ